MIGIDKTELAKRVLYRIETEPEAHEQESWVRYPDPESVLGDGRMPGCTVGGAWRALSLMRRGECGTTACVAGWAVIEALDMGADLNPDSHIDTIAAGLFGIAPMCAVSGNDSVHLFSEHNSTEDVCRMLREMIDGPATGGKERR